MSIAASRPSTEASRFPSCIIVITIQHRSGPLADRSLPHVLVALTFDYLLFARKGGEANVTMISGR